MEQCTGKVNISKHGDVYYAEFIEDNGDEFLLFKSKNLEDIEEYLKAHRLK